MKKRTATLTRKTSETDISASLLIDGSGEVRKIDTGIGFFDHMLDAFARHGFFDLKFSCKGDLNVDAHHSVEDSGIVLGQLFLKALGDKKGIRRYGDAIIPMDETLALCAVDISGRPYFVMDGDFGVEKIGTLDTQVFREFFYAFSYSAMINLHLRILSGQNAHHMVEALFKAFARALDQATQTDDRIRGVLSTKGTLA